jgi:hypothetical protein
VHGTAFDAVHVLAFDAALGHEIGHEWVPFPLAITC